MYTHYRDQPVSAFYGKLGGKYKYILQEKYWSLALETGGTFSIRYELKC